MTVGAILLAAGGSRRFGAENKLLAALDGRPLVTHAALAITDAGLPMIAVLGHEAEAVRAALQPFGPAFVTARDWADGMGRSIAAGARAAQAAEWAGALICLGDMPAVGAATLRALAAAIDAPLAVAAPVHAGRRGNPVGFGHGWFTRLVALAGDAGARGIVGGGPVREIAGHDGCLRDCDTAADLASFGGG